MSLSYLKGPLEPVRFLAPFLLFIVLLGGCVSSGSSTTQAEINQIKHELYTSKKEITALRAEVNTLKKTNPKASKVRRDTELINALRESQANLYTKVSALQVEVQHAYGSMDEQSYRARKDLSSLTSELDLIKTRMEEAEKNYSLALARAAKTGVSNTAASEIKNTPAVKKSTSPQKAYKAAYTLFEQKKYSAAQKEMNAFIKIYPTHILAGNAQFWIGEIHYNNKDYNSSILAYQEVLEKHPKNNKIPASMLKQAYAFIQLGDERAAKGILNNLVRKYPKSDMTGYAKKKLKQLK